MLPRPAADALCDVLYFVVIERGVKSCVVRMGFGKAVVMPLAFVSVGPVKLDHPVSIPAKLLEDLAVTREAFDDDGIAHLLFRRPFEVKGVVKLTQRVWRFTKDQEAPFRVDRVLADQVDVQCIPAHGADQSGFDSGGVAQGLATGKIAFGYGCVERVIRMSMSVFWIYDQEIGRWDVTVEYRQHLFRGDFCAIQGNGRVDVDDDPEDRVRGVVLDVGAL